MTRKYSEDAISLVKPFKGRSKFDIYIHHEGFREAIKELTILLPDEHLDCTRPFKKKMLAKTFDYATLLQHIILYVYSQHQKNKPSEAIQKSIQAATDKACTVCQLEEASGTPSFNEQLLLAYEMVLNELKVSRPKK